MRVPALRESPKILPRAPQRGFQRGASRSQERSFYQHLFSAELEASSSRRQYNNHHWQMRQELSQERSDSRISEVNGHRLSLPL